MCQNEDGNLETSLADDVGIRSNSLLAGALLVALSINFVLGISSILSESSTILRQSKNLSIEEIREERNMDFRQQKPIIEEIKSKVKVSEPLVIYEQGVPLWFIPYYVSPRESFHDSSETFKFLDQRHQKFWHLKMRRQNGGIDWSLNLIERSIKEASSKEASQQQNE